MSDMLRITGLATGIDTDTMVKQLLRVETMKVDRVRQQRQYTEWQRDAYREMSNLLRALKDDYFDFLKPSTNIRSSSVFNTYKATYGGEETSDYLSITATNDSSLSNYPITEIITAKTAKVTSGALAKDIVGTDISNFNISSTADNNKITVTLNGVSKEITISDLNDADINTDITDLVADMQTKINDAFGINSDGTAKVTVGNSGNQLTFNTTDANILKIDYAYNTGAEAIFGKDLSTGITLTPQNNKFKLAVNNSDGTTDTKEIALDLGGASQLTLSLDELVNKLQTTIDSSGYSSNIRVLSQNNKVTVKAVEATGSATGSLAGTTIADSTTITTGSNDTLDITIGTETKSITLAEGTYDKTQLLSEIQKKLDGAFGANKALVSYDNSGQLRFESIAQDRTLSVTSQENGGLEALGLDAINTSNKIDLNAKLSEITSGFLGGNIAPQDTDTDGNDIEFTINNVEFSFKASETSLQDIINSVNNNEQARVTMKYDELNDKLLVESKDTGVTSQVAIADVEGNLMTVLGLNGANANGTDALVRFDDGSANGIEIIRSTNTFTLDGISFDLKKDFTGSIAISIDSDTTKAVEVIKDFVEKYNETISKINERLTEKRYRDYTPLTDEQKKEMSEKDIELWEEKAKSGILRNDSTLENLTSSMREALYEAVEGVGISLFDIGITTSANYLDRGKLVIDENKLKTALKEKGQDIANLFTKDGDTYETKGLSHRLYDVIQDNIRTTRNSNGRKGILLEKAGIEGDITEFKNILDEKINDYDDTINELLDELADKETYYYNMFARMESAISEMNSQSSWLMSQLGGNGGY